MLTLLKYAYFAEVCLLCLSMLTLLTCAYSTRLKSSKHAKISVSMSIVMAPNNPLNIYLPIDCFFKYAFLYFYKNQFEIE